ncbi:Flagellar hook-length control protein-like C-terminal domain-containing protein [Bordetella sputigena]|uniref:hypothetical protein n=1 Tax=Bordetella sputigena TaxID=1416810 RepID=UPI0039EFB13D
MNVSSPGQSPATDSSAHGVSPQGSPPHGASTHGAPAHAGGPPHRGVHLTEGARRVLLRVPPPNPDDAALFRALLSEGGANETTRVADARDLHAGFEQLAFRPEREDEIARVTGRQAEVDRQEHTAIDTMSVAPLDLAALSGMVTKVYLDSLHDGHRAIGVALNEDLLPATRLSIQEREGRLAVDFVSIDPLARDRLRRGATALADRIAGDLSRDVAVKVASHEGDRWPLEVRADAAPVPQGRGAV